MIYTCERCGYKNKIKTKFIRHLSRKNKCKPIKSNIKIEIFYKNMLNETRSISGKNDPDLCTKKSDKRKYICDHCSTSFTFKSNLKRHYGRCKVLNKEKILEVENKTILKKINDYKNENSKLKNVNSQLMSKIKKLENNKIDEEKLRKNITNDILNQLKKNPTITLNNSLENIMKKENSESKRNSYKKTDYSHLKDSDYLDAIRKGNMGIPSIVEKVHFNPKKRENNNIYITNLKSEYMQVFNGTEWETQLTEDFLNFLVQDNADRIEDKIEEWHDTNHIYSTEEYESVLDKYPRFLDRLSEVKYVSSKVRREVKLILFNKRKLPKLPFEEKLSKSLTKKFKLNNTTKTIGYKENIN